MTRIKERYYTIINGQRVLVSRYAEAAGPKHKDITRPPSVSKEDVHGPDEDYDDPLAGLSIVEIPTDLED